MSGYFAFNGVIRLNDWNWRGVDYSNMDELLGLVIQLDFKVLVMW